MEITAKIPHPTFPSFITTIRYLDRAAILRKQSKIQRTQKPYVVKDPDTGKPFLLADGSPYVVWRAELPDDFALDSIAEYVVSWEGLELDGKTVPYSPDGLAVLLDSRLDVAGEKDGAVSWSRVLADKAYDRKVFDPDPKT